jgi:hypothetical protein
MRRTATVLAAVALLAAFAAGSSLASAAAKAPAKNPGTTLRRRPIGAGPGQHHHGPDITVIEPPGDTDHVTFVDEPPAGDSEGDEQPSSARWSTSTAPGSAPSPWPDS